MMISLAIILHLIVEKVSSDWVLSGIWSVVCFAFNAATFGRLKRPCVKIDARCLVDCFVMKWTKHKAWLARIANTLQIVELATKSFIVCIYHSRIVWQTWMLARNLYLKETTKNSKTKQISLVSEKNQITLTNGRWRGPFLVYQASRCGELIFHEIASLTFVFDCWVCVERAYLNHVLILD